MNRYMIDEFYQDPALRRRLFAKAHEERTRAVRAGLTWLWRHVKALATPRRPVRWIARLG